jgi:uncharacterized protein (TIGR02246 family)
MEHRPWRFLTGGLVAALTIGVLSARDDPAPKTPVAVGLLGDEEAIRATAREFAAAFNKGDANAVAAQWTEHGECSDADGTVIGGRANIERAFAEFFKANPLAKIQVLVQSVRFPSPDLAIEEGILRQINTVRDLPSTTLYSATHVRIGFKWQTASSREWGAGQDRLADLDWLLGKWTATVKDKGVTLAFTRDEQKPFIDGKFTATTADKAVSTGTLRIGLDPQTGGLRSWHFAEDGGHGQSLWARDGNRWVLDATGVLADGTETAALNILGRINNDEITWQSIDRVLGDQELPDTTPIKLTRMPAAK